MAQKLVLKKVMIVTNVATPYRVPLFNQLHQNLEAAGSELLVVFAVKGYARRQWQLNEQDFKFAYRFLSDELLGSAENTTFKYPGLTALIRRERPDVVLTPGFSRATLKVCLHRFMHPLKHVMWTGSVLPQGKNDPLLRKLYRRFLVNRIRHFITYSEASKGYLKLLGAKPDQVTVAINTVDVNFFISETDRIRESMAPKPDFNLLYIGYLTPRKNVGRLIEVMDQLGEQLPEAHLHLVGDGEQRAALETQASASGFADRIHFHGYQQKKDLPTFLAHADVFLFQTDFDIWGLVLNETMAAGLPVIASDKAVSSRELLTDGSNGYVVDFADTSKICMLIGDLYHDPELRNQLATRARETILQQATLKHMAEQMIHAVTKAVK